MDFRSRQKIMKKIEFARVVVAALGLIYLAPPLLLWSPDIVARLCGGLAWLAMSIAFLPTLRSYSAPPLLAVLLPLIALFYIAATVASAVQFWCGRGGLWKGRFQAVGQLSSPTAWTRGSSDPGNNENS